MSTDLPEKSLWTVWAELVSLAQQLSFLHRSIEHTLGFDRTAFDAEYGWGIFYLLESLERKAVALADDLERYHARNPQWEHRHE